MYSARQRALDGSWVVKEWEDEDECIQEFAEFAELCDDVDIDCNIWLWDETPPAEIQDAMEADRVKRPDDLYNSD